MNVKQGDLAEVIESLDGAAVGMHVRVIAFQGNHSKLGPIWRCRSDGTIVTEFGGVGQEADFADAWLKKIEPPQNQDVDVKELEKVD